MSDKKPQAKPVFRKCVVMKHEKAGEVQVAEEEQKLWELRGFKKASDAAPANEQGGSSPSPEEAKVPSQLPAPADEDTKASKGKSSK